MAAQIQQNISETNKRIQNRKTAERRNRVENLLLKYEDKRRSYKSIIHTKFFKSQENQNSGWKIHIAANKKNDHDVLRIVEPYLYQNDLSSRVMRPSLNHALIDEGKQHRGEFITIYPLLIKKNRQQA
jgi:hypothetical protein